MLKNNDNKNALKASELIAILEQYPPDIEIVFEGTAISNSSFTSIKLPVTSIKSVKKYSDSDTQYLPLHGIKKEEY